MSQRPGRLLLAPPLQQDFSGVSSLNRKEAGQAPPGCEALRTGLSTRESPGGVNVLQNTDAWVPDQLNWNVWGVGPGHQTIISKSKSNVWPH